MIFSRWMRITTLLDPLNQSIAAVSHTTDMIHCRDLHGDCSAVSTIHLDIAGRLATHCGYDAIANSNLQPHLALELENATTPPSP
jgi:hypothetical protein